MIPRRHPAFVILLVSALTTAVIPSGKTGAQSSTSSRLSMATDDRVQAPGWWPTKSAPLRSTFVGTSECAKCHEKQALTYINTPMAQASAPTPYSQILHLTEHMSAQRPPYRYELVRSASSVDYSVAEGSDSLSTTLNWAFGLGHKGQTYIYQRNGAFYESRLSFYRTLQGLDLTTGHDTATPDSLESALGRRMDADETRRCFACHTTASTIAHKFDPAHVTPGVTCEACHGPGAKHVVAMKAGKIEDGRRATFDLHRLDPVASVDFCGACHRTWGDVLQGGFTGVVNVRFQPYRLENSKCWGKGDPRLTCVACHDPHQQVAVDPGSYDEKCLACHASASDTASSVPSGRESAAPEKATACPEGTQDCVTCHMPQVELPSIHSPFTDHRIRIVRQDDSYPN